MGIILSNDYEIENLEGEVSFLKDKVAAHWAVDRVLADFGIRVIGRVDTAAELPDVSGDFEYGDAYAVGTEGSEYDYYIYTRPFGDESENHWFDIGALQIVGPEGPEGETGPQGPRGYKTNLFLVGVAAEVEEITPEAAQGDPWYTTLTNLDLAMTADGTVYQYFDYSQTWVQTNYNLRGPQGLMGSQGPRGEQGPQGAQGIPGIPGERGLGLVLLGILESTSNLPAPNSVRRDGSYIIQVDGADHLYAITGLGTQADPLVWTDLGLYTLTTEPSEGVGGTMYLHRIEYSFTDYNGGSGTVYFDLYLPSSTPLNSSTVWPYFPSTPEAPTMTCTGCRTNTEGKAEIIYAIAYLHEYDEYYTTGLLTIDPSTGYTNSIYGFSETSFTDKVYDL